MFDIFGEIEEWFRFLLSGFVTSNMTTMFTDVNDKTSGIDGGISETTIYVDLQFWPFRAFSLW